MMDIAEIRKKAQREREQGQAVVRPAAPPPPREEKGPTLPVVEDDGGFSDDFFSAVVPDVSLPVVAPPLASVIVDPLAVILEGRKAALAVNEEQSEALADGVHGDASSLEVLCFRVADEIYGLDIMELKEIIKPREATEIPHAPPFIAGVLSLRGIIIPVFVLRERLGLDAGGGRSRERIIVVKRGEGLCGLLVDEVTQVIRIDAGSVEQPPAVLDGIDREFVWGIGRHEGRIVILLNLEKVLDASLA